MLSGIASLTKCEYVLTPGFYGLRRSAAGTADGGAINEERQSPTPGATANPSTPAPKALPQTPAPQRQKRRCITPSNPTNPGTPQRQKRRCITPSNPTNPGTPQAPKALLHTPPSALKRPSAPGTADGGAINKERQSPTPGTTPNPKIRSVQRWLSPMRSRWRKNRCRCRKWWGWGCRRC